MMGRNLREGVTVGVPAGSPLCTVGRRCIWHGFGTVAAGRPRMILRAGARVASRRPGGAPTTRRPGGSPRPDGCGPRVALPRVVVW